MKPQAMRRTILRDIPRNVTPREYAFYSLQWALVIVGFVGAAGTLLASLRGDAGKAVARLESLPALGVAEAAASSQGAQSEALPLVRIEGMLGASRTAAMPDEPSLEVILGSLELIAKSTGSARDPKEAVLHRWDHAPDALTLVDGAATLQLDLELAFVPRTRGPGATRPGRLTDGAAVRLAKTVGYRYLDQDWALPEAWGAVRSASGRVERTYVEVNSPFVVVGELALGPDGPMLTVDPASGGEVHGGTMDEIRESAKKLGSRLRFAWIPLSLGALWLLRRVLRIRRDFVRRSNAS